MSRLSPRICTVPGPDTIGVGQRKHFTALWTIWFGSTGVRIVKKAAVFDPGDAMGEPCEVFADELANHLSACFDQNSRPVVAVERYDGTVEIRKLVGGDEQRFVFEGRQPQLFYNWQVLYFSDDSDVVCFYLKEDGRKIYARFQRDEFDTEYVMNELHCELALLEETDSILQQQRLFGRTTGGRVVTLLSRLYPPFPAEAIDTAEAAQQFLSGVHDVALVTTQGQDAASEDTKLQSGLYVIKVIFASGSDLAVNTTQLLDGEHVERLVLVVVPDDTAAGDVKLLSGVYFLRVVPANAGLDKGVNTTAIDGGSYFKAVIDGRNHADTGQQTTDFLEGSHQLA